MSREILIKLKYKLEASKYASFKSEDDDLGVEFLPNTIPPTDAAVTQPPAKGPATNPCPGDSGTQPRPTGPTSWALRQSLLKFKNTSRQPPSNK